MNTSRTLSSCLFTLLEYFRGKLPQNSGRVETLCLGRAPAVPRNLHEVRDVQFEILVGRERLVAVVVVDVDDTMICT